MAIERLTPEDELMLWPDKAWPQDIGALIILDGGDLLDGHGRLKREAVIPCPDDLHALRKPDPR